MSGKRVETVSNQESRAAEEDGAGAERCFSGASPVLSQVPSRVGRGLGSDVLLTQPRFLMSAVLLSSRCVSSASAAMDIRRSLQLFKVSHLLATSLLKRRGGIRKGM